MSEDEARGNEPAGASAPSEPASADSAAVDADALGQGRTRCGFVALIGAPNAGKSTLVNALVGAKVSIVTHKVQTTRAVVRGIMIEGDAQIILLDTPGIFEPRRRLDRAMVKAAWVGAADADRIAVLLDARRGIDEANSTLLERVAATDGAKTLLLTKVDLVKPPTLLALAQAANAAARFDQTFMISATTDSGIADLRRYFADAVPEGPWLYPADQLTDIAERQLAAEITREALINRLHDELPYAATVETEMFTDLRDGSARIEQTVFVEREGQKKIVLGEKGRSIKAISIAAREAIGEALGRKIHLFLFVKVRPRWGDDPERYRQMGLDYSP